jgi:hypothetical protein
VWYRDANDECAWCGPGTEEICERCCHRQPAEGAGIAKAELFRDRSGVQEIALVPSLQVAYVWHASVFTREVLDGLLRIGFLHHQQIIWDKTRTVLTRTHYWFQHEPCWYVRKKNAPWFGKAGENSTIWSCPSPKFIMIADWRGRAAAPFRSELRITSHLISDQSLTCTDTRSVLRRAYP